MTSGSVKSLKSALTGGPRAPEAAPTSKVNDPSTELSSPSKTVIGILGVPTDVRSTNPNSFVTTVVSDAWPSFTMIVEGENVTTPPASVNSLFAFPRVRSRNEPDATPGIPMGIALEVPVGAGMIWTFLVAGGVPPKNGSAGATMFPSKLLL
jgi:hypothetical protein